MTRHHGSQVRLKIRAVFTLTCTRETGWPDFSHDPLMYTAHKCCFGCRGRESGCSYNPEAHTLLRGNCRASSRTDAKARDCVETRNMVSSRESPISYFLASGHFSSRSYSHLRWLRPPSAALRFPYIWDETSRFLPHPSLASLIATGRRFSGAASGEIRHGKNESSAGSQTARRF